jgi:hypothetical protein
VSRREAWLTALGIFVVALAVRTWAAAGTVFPRPEDSAYYVGVARNIAEGRGIVSDALWSYGTPPLVFPRPAFEVWLPLPSLLAAIPAALVGGPTPMPLLDALRSAQLVTVVLGALLAVLAWRLGLDVAEERRLPTSRARVFALGVGLTAAVYLPLILHSVAPDSTIPFGVLVLAACLLATRVLRAPRGARFRDPRLLGISVLLGLAALTRNEAIWLALTWAFLAWRVPGATRQERLRLIGIVAVVALIVFSPWAVRDWIVFGSPLPGQAASNAFSVTGFDIFAWQDPPTLARYLAVGPAELLSMRFDGTVHNLVSVLLVLGLPVSVIGLLALPWQARDRALRPVVLVGATTFLVTSLVFPVATTWGTFLHAAVPVHVLLIVSTVGALDAGLARLAARMGWERPVAWLGTLLAVGWSVLFSAALLPSAADASASTARTYQVLAEQLKAVGQPLDGSSPIITDFPIWTAEAERVPALALPDEPPSSVADLARHFGAKLLVIASDTRGIWPETLTSGDPAAACFHELALPTPSDPADADAVRNVRAWRIACP